MSRVQLKRRKKREKGSVSVRSLICAVAGLVGILFLIYGIYSASIVGEMPRQVTGLSMIFFFASIVEVIFGIRFAKIPGHSAVSRAWGIILPSAALAGYLGLYVSGLYSIL